MLCRYRVLGGWVCCCHQSETVSGLGLALYVRVRVLNDIINYLDQLLLEPASPLVHVLVTRDL